MPDKIHLQTGLVESLRSREKQKSPHAHLSFVAACMWFSMLMLLVQGEAKMHQADVSLPVLKDLAAL